MNVNELIIRHSVELGERLLKLDVPPYEVKSYLQAVFLHVAIRRRRGKGEEQVEEEASDE